MFVSPLDVAIRSDYAVIDGDPKLATPNERVHVARRVLDHLNVGIDTVGVLYPRPFKSEE